MYVMYGATISVLKLTFQKIQSLLLIHLQIFYLIYT